MEPVPQAAAVPPSDEGSAILKVLSSSPLSTERIVELTEMTTSDVLSELTMLELEGRVIRSPMGYALIP